MKKWCRAAHGPGTVASPSLPAYAESRQIRRHGNFLWCGQRQFRRNAPCFFLGEFKFHVDLQGRDFFLEHRGELLPLTNRTQAVLRQKLDAGGNRIDLGKAESFGGARNFLRRSLDVRNGRGFQRKWCLWQTGAQLGDFGLRAREETQRQGMLRHLRRTGITGLRHCNPPWCQQSCMAGRMLVFSSPNLSAASHSPSHDQTSPYLVKP